MLLHMSPDRRADEDIAALLKRVMDAVGMSQSEIAERSGIPLATLNAWVTRRRAPGRGPRASTSLRNLAEALPGVTVKDVFEAAGRQVPGRLGPEAEQRMLEMYRSLSPHRQRMAAQMLEALNAEERSTSV